MIYHSNYDCKTRLKNLPDGISYVKYETILHNLLKLNVQNEKISFIRLIIWLINPAIYKKYMSYVGYVFIFNEHV